MAGVILNDQRRFPIGTSVGAYLRTNWTRADLGATNSPSGAPKGSAAATATVAADGTIDFSALAAGKYWAYALVGSEHRYTRFECKTAADVPGGDAEASESDLATEVTRATAAEATELARATAAEALLIPKSIGDNKGDLIGFSADNTPVKIAKASADGKVLRSLAVGTGGFEWADGSGVGLLAARPAANAVPVGWRYYATDDDGGIEYLSDGANWIALDLAGREVANGYAAITSTFTYSTDNNVTDVTGLTITFTPKQAAVDILLGGFQVAGNTTAMSPSLFIADGSGTLLEGVKEQIIIGALSFSIGTMKSRQSLTPGNSYTFKAQIARGLAGASAVSLVAAATNPAWIQAIYR